MYKCQLMVLDHTGIMVWHRQIQLGSRCDLFYPTQTLALPWPVEQFCWQKMELVDTGWVSLSARWLPQHVVSAGGEANPGMPVEAVSV